MYPAQRQPKITRTYLVRPTELFRATDSEAEQRYRQQQAKELMDLIRSEVARANRFNVSGIPEMAANDAFMFAQGWVQAVTRTAPDIIDELADEVKSSQCSESSSPAERITLARMTAAMPELATPEGLDCTVQRHPHEDMVLWSALEAWRASGLPKSAAMAEIERAAKDPRTHFHFSSDDEMKRQVLAAQDDEPSAGSEVLTEAVRIDPHD